MRSDDAISEMLDQLERFANSLLVATQPRGPTPSVIDAIASHGWQDDRDFANKTLKYVREIRMARDIGEYDEALGRALLLVFESMMLDFERQKNAKAASDKQWPIFDKHFAGVFALRRENDAKTAAKKELDQQIVTYLEHALARGKGITKAAKECPIAGYRKVMEVAKANGLTKKK